MTPAPTMHFPLIPHTYIVLEQSSHWSTRPRDMSTSSLIGRRRNISHVHKRKYCEPCEIVLNLPSKWDGIFGKFLNIISLLGILGGGWRICVSRERGMWFVALYMAILARVCFSGIIATRHYSSHTLDNTCQFFSSSTIQGNTGRSKSFHAILDKHYLNIVVNGSWTGEWWHLKAL